jgi:hypothetical protein
MIRRQYKGEKIRVTFVIPDSTTIGKVSVVGDFNGWQPGKHLLVKRKNGTRSVAVSPTRVDPAVPLPGRGRPLVRRPRRRSAHPRGQRPARLSGLSGSRRPLLRLSPAPGLGLSGSSNGQVSGCRHLASDL